MDGGALGNLISKTSLPVSSLKTLLSSVAASYPGFYEEVFQPDRDLSVSYPLKGGMSWDDEATMYEEKARERQKKPIVLDVSKEGAVPPLYPGHQAIGAAQIPPVYDVRYKRHG